VPNMLQSLRSAVPYPLLSCHLIIVLVETGDGPQVVTAADGYAGTHHLLIYVDEPSHAIIRDEMPSRRCDDDVAMFFFSNKSRLLPQMIRQRCQDSQKCRQLPLSCHPPRLASNES